MSAASAVAAERAVLGAVLADGTAFYRIADRLRVEDFDREEHRAAWGAMGALAKAGTPIDLLTLTHQLEVTGDLDRAGGIASMAALAEGLPDLANVEHYAATVASASQKRRMVVFGQWIAAQAEQPEGDADQLNAEAVERLTAISAPTIRTVEPVAALVARELARLEQHANAGQAGLQTGFRDIDSLLLGMERQALIVVAGRPGVGKTALALNIAAHVCSNGARAAFFSLEMSSGALMRRLFSQETGVLHARLRLGRFERPHWQDLTAAGDRLSGWPLLVDDTAGLSALDIEARCRRIQEVQGLDLVIVDYLGKMRADGENRTQVVGAIARGLKDLAKRLDVPVLALCQLSRLNDRENRKPNLSDLRDSGEIEQEADVVLLLHPDSEDVRGDRPATVIQVEVAKHRNGATGIAKLIFLGDCLQFKSYIAKVQ